MTLLAALASGCGNAVVGDQGQAASWTRCRGASIKAATEITQPKPTRRPPAALGPNGGLAPDERRIGQLLSTRVVRLVNASMIQRDRASEIHPGLERTTDPAQIANGLILDDGRVVTAAHAITTDAPLWVELDGRYLRATVADRDATRDLALLRLAGTFTIAGTIRTGDSTSGRALTWSRLRRDSLPKRFPIVNRIQILPGPLARWNDSTAKPGTPIHDARRACGGDLYPGRSGSPAFTADGELVGVAVAKGGQDAGVDGSLIAPVPRGWIDGTR